MFGDKQGYGQEIIGLNEIRGITRNQYGAGIQNWAITQDVNNRLYVANNEGLLIFNGTNWQILPVPNKTILRSIAFDKYGKLYAGAQDELGYFAPDNAGKLQYTSLKDLLPDSAKKFADVWELEVVGNDVFFRTDPIIFKLTGQKFTSYPSSSKWLSLHQYQGKAIAHEKDRGLFIYQNNTWQPFIGETSLPPGFFITDIKPGSGDTCLLSTTKNGLYLLVQNKLVPFKLIASDFNASQHFTSLSWVDDSSFLAGTYFNGAYRITRQGKILENISTKNGLPNNTVRCIFTNKNGNSWIGLDNGIVFFACNNPIKHINPAAFNNGAGYSAKTVGGNIYFALSTGLQWLPLSSAADLSSITAKPKLLLSGLTWNLSVLDNQLLVGRDDGFWKVTNHQASLISSKTGYWTYRPIEAGAYPLQIAAGNYLGIKLYETNNGNILEKGGINKFSESSRYVETDGATIWVSHPYRGIYKITLPDYTVTHYNQKNGLPDDLDNHVFKIKGKILFATKKGIYEYNKQNDKMQKAKDYALLFGNRPVRYLTEDDKGNIWFVQDKMLGVADYTNQNPVINYIPELKNKIVSGFENIFPYNTSNVIVGGQDGFYNIDYQKYHQSIQPFTAYITSVKIIGSTDSILYGGYSLNSLVNKPALPYKHNSLHFAYSASIVHLNTELEFSYFLQGFDKSWSIWEQTSTKDYTNLPAGSYVFHVKARNGPSQESKEYTYSFKISPPWYKTLWAYTLYVLTLFEALYLLFKHQVRKQKQKMEAKRQEDQKKFEEEQRQMAYLHRLQMEQSEKELIRLQNEKLEVEIERKNAELANTALNLVQKKEYLSKIADILNKLNKPGNEPIEPGELKKLLRSLGSEEKLDEEWRQFSIHFNNVHNNFLITLQNKYPGLKPHELRLCAYLRMNLSSKEMARLLSISVRGVEISRYRLRKKLQLQPKEDLFQFLMQVDAEGKSPKQNNQTSESTT